MRRIANDAFGREPTLEELALNDKTPDVPATAEIRKKIAERIFENCSTRLVLANHTLKQLNIINDGNVKPSKLSCVSQMLNDCLTPMGKRKFMYLFLNPVYDEEYLNNHCLEFSSFRVHFVEPG